MEKGGRGTCRREGMLVFWRERRVRNVWEGEQGVAEIVFSSETEERGKCGREDKRGDKKWNLSEKGVRRICEKESTGRERTFVFGPKGG
jgi:hypothetical protein